MKINVYTTGYADKVVIRFSPELEAMQYVDVNGNTYDYRNLTGYYVYFPADSSATLDNTVRDNHVYWKYILPLAPSTKGWDNAILKNAYYMTIIVYRGTDTVTYTIDDIHIAGNTQDLIFIQPGN